MKPLTTIMGRTTTHALPYVADQPRCTDDHDTNIANGCCKYNSVKVCVDGRNGNLVAFAESTVCAGDPGIEVIRVRQADNCIVLCGNQDERAAANNKSTMTSALDRTLRVISGGRMHMRCSPAAAAAGGHLKLVVVVHQEEQGGRRETEHVLVAPFVMPISAAATNAMCIALMSASFQYGLRIVDTSYEDGGYWTTSGWLYGAEVFRLRHDGALVLLPRNRRMPVQEVDYMTTLQRDAFYNTFLCLRAAVRATQPNYDLIMDLGDATGKTWVLALGHARVTLEPGMRLPLCLLAWRPRAVYREKAGSNPREYHRREARCLDCVDQAVGARCGCRCGRHR